MKPVLSLLLPLAAAVSLHAAHAQERPLLRIINGSKQAVDLFKVDADDKRTASGGLEPGRDTILRPAIGDRFLLIGRDDQIEASVTAEVPVQGFRFDPPAKYGIPAFYTQVEWLRGFPIVASAKVSPYAVKEAAYICDLMLAKRPDVLEAMIKSGSRLCIMAHDEFTTDLPDFEWLGERPMRGFENFTGKEYWDARARGTGGSAHDPYCSCAEENLLGYDGDPYSTENILIHEFAHSIHLRGLNNVDPTFDRRLRETYEAAIAKGLWKDTYAGSNYSEYFAEGVQSWFDNNRENDGIHNHVNTRAELIEYDPDLAAILREVFGDTEIKYTKPATRLHGHMEGYDPSKAPRFTWPERLGPIQTAIRNPGGGGGGGGRGRRGEGN